VSVDGAGVAATSVGRGREVITVVIMVEMGERNVRAVVRVAAREGRREGQEMREGKQKTAEVGGWEQSSVRMYGTAAT